MSKLASLILKIIQDYYCSSSVAITREWDSLNDSLYVNSRYSILVKPCILFNFIFIFET